MSRRNQEKGRIEGPFVPMLVDTMSSSAWKAMSPYARVVYYALKSRYGHKIRNNGRIYLSARDGAEDTGFDMKTVARSLRELRHYGFIVEMQTYCLGFEGKGKATHWRLTELGYMLDPPTRDFLKWDGEMFHEQKSPAFHKRQKRSLAKLKKQNPAPLHGTGCTTERNITVFQGAVHLPDKVFQGAVHTDEGACTMERHISRVNHYAVPDVPLMLLTLILLSAWFLTPLFLLGCLCCLLIWPLWLPWLGFMVHRLKRQPPLDCLCCRLCWRIGVMQMPSDKYCRSAIIAADWLA